MLEELTFRQLQKHHDQATIALEEARDTGNEKAYRAAERLEERVHMEKVRRMQRRGP